MKLGEKAIQRIELEKQNKIRTNLLALNKYRESRHYEHIRNKTEYKATTSVKIKGLWD